jgi:hypothetical protein
VNHFAFWRSVTFRSASSMCPVDDDRRGLAGAVDHLDLGRVDRRLAAETFLRKHLPGAHAREVKYVVLKFLPGLVRLPRWAPTAAGALLELDRTALDHLGGLLGHPLAERHVADRVVEVHRVHQCVDLPDDFVEIRGECHGTCDPPDLPVPRPRRCMLGFWSALAKPDAVAWPPGLGLLVAASALYVGLRAGRPREPWEHVDSFRIGPPPEATPDPARRVPNGASGPRR